MRNPQGVALLKPVVFAPKWGAAAAPSERGPKGVGPASTGICDKTLTALGELRLFSDGSRRYR
ncbi:MAG: hypothetical protein KME26_19800 [Oscillatoria princeps RMCB-10]|nr:hypothetical protein [Oscillatoria princeps RMCB-10]